MCFVLGQNQGFLARAIAPQLSLQMIVAASSSSNLSSSTRRFLSQTASLVAYISPIYSTLQDNRAIIGYLFNNQLITPLLILKTYPMVERLVIISPAQSKLVYLTSSSREPEQVNSRLIVPRRYQKICFKALIQGSLRLAI